MTERLARNIWQHTHMATEFPLGGTIIRKSTSLRDFVPKDNKEPEIANAISGISGGLRPPQQWGILVVVKGLFT